MTRPDRLRPLPLFVPSPAPVGAGSAPGDSTAARLLAGLPWLARLGCRRLPARWSARLLLRLLRRRLARGSEGLALRARVLPASAMGGALLELSGDALDAGLPRALGPARLHAAALEQLFRALVHPQAHVDEVQVAPGQPCRIALHWPLS